MPMFLNQLPTSALCAAVALAVATLTAGNLHADETSAKPAVSQEQAAVIEGQANTLQSQHTNIHWGFNLGGAYQARTDIDGGGDFAVTRHALSGGAVIQLTDRLELNFNAGMERYEYRFSSVTRMGNEPWENISIAGAQAALGLRLNDQWTLYGSPLVNLAAEDSADLADAFTGGVAMGFNYVHNAAFNFGAGIGIMSQLDDSVSIFPIVRFNWEMADQWTLRSGMFTLGVQGGAGLELEFRPIENVALALGAQYQQRRFRLDDEGIAPEGVGEEYAIPVYLRVTWFPCRNFTVSGFGGVLFGGGLALYDEDGHKVAEKNFDPAFVFGARIGVQF